MISEIIVALIGGLVTLSGVLIANSKAQAVTDTRIDELTREVREHNHFARRVPVLEEQMKVVNHRIDDLERKGDCYENQARNDCKNRRSGSGSGKSGS